MSVEKKFLADMVVLLIVEDGDLHEIRKIVHEMKGNVILDLSRVRAFDSEWASVLVVVQRAFNKQGGKLVLLNLPEKPLRLLKLANLIQLFKVFDSEEDAIKSFTHLA